MKTGWRLIGFWLLWVGGLVSVSQASADAPPVNVSYASVLELDFASAQQKIPFNNSGTEFGLLWLPPAQQANKPLVVFLHGGCWLNAYDIDHSQALTAALAEAGYPVLSVEYLRTGDPGGGWPGTLSSVIDGIDKGLQTLQGKLATDRYVLAGHSAGGHLALLAGQTVSKRRSLQPFRLNAVVGLAAITDVVKYAQGGNSCQQATLSFMGGAPEANTEAYRLANPSKAETAFSRILLHGDADTLVPLSQSTWLMAPRKIVAGAGHFDWLHPQTAAFATLLSTLEKL